MEVVNAVPSLSFFENRERLIECENDMVCVELDGRITVGDKVVNLFEYDDDELVFHPVVLQAAFSSNNNYPEMEGFTNLTPFYFKFDIKNNKVLFYCRKVKIH